MFILAFLALIPRSILGFLILRWIWKSADTRDVLIQICLAGPLGIGLSSLAGFLWIWSGLDLRSYVLLETVLVLFAATMVLLKYGSDFLRNLKDQRNRAGRSERLWLGLLLAGLGIFTGTFWAHSLQNPHGWWDAWAIWNATARFIFRGGEHWLGTFMRTPLGHPDYPLLLGLSNASTWELLRRETVRGPVALAFMFAFSLPGLLFSLLNRLRGAAQASLGTVVLVSMPFVAMFAMSLYADVPEAVYFLGAAGLIPVYASGRDRGVPILAGLMAGISAWTKNEGLTFIPISLMAWAVLSFIRKDRLALWNFLIGLALPLVVIVLFKSSLAPRDDFITGREGILALMLDRDRLELVLSAMLQGSLSGWNAGDGPVRVVWLLIAYAILVGRSESSTHPILPVALAVAAQLGVYFLTYVISPFDLVWHITNSLSRLYLHLVPLILLCIFLKVRSPDEFRTKSEV